MRALTRAPFLALAVLTLGCGSSSTDVPLPWDPSPFPSIEHDDVSSERFELGRRLFFDPIMSIDEETACGTCHSDVWGLGDGLPLSVGHGAGILAGPGREGPNVLRRNAPSLWNLSFRKTLLWDGRVDTLEEQALEPFKATDEFNRTPHEVVADIAAIDDYRQRFADAFPDDPRVTVQNMAVALADYQRTFVSNNSLYDGYVEGDLSAMSDAMVQGMFLFAEFGCGDCHTQPLFESERFEDRNVPAAAMIEDAGRFEVTGDERDRGAFRVPTLRNVAFASPYFHNGSVQFLEDAIRHELSLSGKAFDDTDVKLIKAFIGEALVDESREPQRPLVVPSGLPVPLDGTAVMR